MMERGMHDERGDSAADTRERESAFGDALSRRLEQQRGETATASEERRPEHDETEAVSPELALVDPDAAAAWRTRLPDPLPLPPLPPAPRPAPREPRPAPPPPPVPAPASPPRRRRRLLRALTLSAVGAAGVALGLALLVDREAAPTLQPVVPTTRSVPTTTPEEPTPTPTTTDAPTARPERQTFAWAPTAGAAAYEFQLFRGATRVYRARVRASRLVLPRRWRERGRAYTLEPGEYRWYVWPVSAATGRPARVATVQARLRVE
jgi:hypothetical protein